MYDISSFGLKEMTRCGNFLRKLGKNSSNMEETANRVVRHLYDKIIDGETGERAFSLVRLFITENFSNLEKDQKLFVQKKFSGLPDKSDFKCLTLLGTVGENPNWDSRQTSESHQAIPIPSEKEVNQLPMVASLIRQLGLDLDHVIKTGSGILLVPEEKLYGVFHVPNAVGSPYIPAQKEFVESFGIQSVVGFGGLLISGEMFAVIMFSKAHIDVTTANLFQTIALNVKIALAPFETAARKKSSNEKDRLKLAIASLENLIDVQENAVVEQTDLLNREIIQRKKTENELKISTAKLILSNRDLEYFASIASHDLQEPLRKITLFGDRLNSAYGPKLDEKGKDMLQRMQNAAHRMRNFIDDLLELSKISAKGVTFQPTNLYEIIMEVMDDLEARIQQTQAQIHCVNLPELSVDRLHIKRLFQNLISNSLKFHRKGVPPVVHLKGSNDGKGQWVISVQDNGIGFDEKYGERIFRPFERLNNRSSFEGSGIGLAICEKIIDLHKGTISVKSRPGKGTVFFIGLPENQN